MFFMPKMKKRTLYLYSSLLLLVFLVWVITGNDSVPQKDEELTKVALREVGNQLLLSNADSTSLVLPVIKLEAKKYKLSFEKPLVVEPDSLVSIIDRNFKKTGLDDHYIVEVIKCKDQEVGYSFEMKYTEEESIIPCSGRNLPSDCYTIEVGFMKQQASFFNKQFYLYLLVLLILIFIVHFLILQQKQGQNTQNTSECGVSIGSYHFYPEQNKLVLQAKEIGLSKKECELLEIFIENINQIVKRDELTKKVWEDHGVFVGRSLDTYISKLRKKLQDDESIKLTNVHGVGYKLEIDNS